jgi:2-polyprenyl-3-methyl-5-hydroxy-6-metoxy-1,4-benzoquinol methylase
VLDYGCGVGSLTELLTEAFDTVSGYDPSTESLELAAKRVPRATLTSDPTALPDDHFESVILAGVLHHVPPSERPGVLDTVLRKLKPGGRIFVFEHNPINPLTRRAVADCPFDEDAVLLWPWQVRRTLASAGFAQVDLDYIVFFPKPLAFLRSLERRLAWCALGAQTLTCGRRP